MLYTSYHATHTCSSYHRLFPVDMDVDVDVDVDMDVDVAILARYLLKEIIVFSTVKLVFGTV